MLIYSDLFKGVYIVKNKDLCSVVSETMTINYS